MTQSTLILTMAKHHLLESLAAWTESAASEFMLLDRTDLPGMAKFYKTLNEKAEECLKEKNEPCQTAGAALQAAAKALHDKILDKRTDTDAIMKEISDTLDMLAKLATPNPAGKKTKNKSQRPEWVDDTIIKAYIEQQLSTLPDMEQVVLAYETSADPELLASLKRSLHTIKGESGVIGAFEIEQICHTLEDCIAEADGSLQTDALLQALDWIGTAVKQLASDVHITPPPALIETLANPGEKITKGTAEPPLPITPPEESPATQNATPVTIMDHDLARDFVVEAQEHLDASDQHLMILEKEPTNKDSIAAVFRSVHTIKGVAGFIGLTPICDLAHAAETLLDSIRKERRTFSGPSVDAVFSALDLLKLMVANLKNALVEDTPFPIPPNLASCIANLESIPEGDATSAKTPTSLPPYEEQATSPTGASQQGSGNAGETSQVMKVDAARVDLLLDTIGELVIAESIVRGDPEIKSIRSVRLEQRLALLNKTTRALQDMAMSLRLVPVDPVFRKMARLIRDLCRKSGKQVELNIEGGDTEIDKSMVDRLSDPLVHMVRNSVDHGIENKETRLQNGKSKEGHLTLRAYHKGGSVRIEIEDDGKGLDREAILKKAIEKHLIESSEGMSDSDIFNLIFESGFSTAAKITEISGRGVGMDVVRREIEALRGSIFIESTPGMGAKFTLALPLTTAIIDGMLLRVAQEIFILPTLSVIESIRPRKGQITTVTAKGEVISFRNELLPLIRLSSVLHVDRAITDPTEAIVIIVEDTSQKWGFMVDDLLGQQQIVIRSLGSAIGNVQGITGASILADGKPGLIIDPSEIIRIACQATSR
jgi:two-component system, chemotaxis family, sensor kinase CheA